MPSHFDPLQSTISDKTNTSRRRFLQIGACAASSLILPRAFAGSPVHSVDFPERKLSLLNLHTGESLSATYWVEGEYQNSELTAINHLLRDHRTGDIHTIDKTLLDLLNTLQQTLGSNQPFQIISGYRSAKTNASLNKKSNGVAKKSLHMQGKAIDIRLPGCQLKDLHKAAIECQAGGVGYYQKSNFIHIDTGRIRRWG